MEIKEIKDALDNLKTEVKENTSAEVKSAIETLEAKYNEAVAEKVKEANTELKDLLAKTQSHVDSLDTRLQEKVKKELDSKEKDVIKKAIKENFDNIKAVESGQKKQFKFHTKDMTLGSNLTGDQPRTYNFDIVQAPMQMINVSDLATTVPISGGTYTFVRETLASNNIGVPSEGAAKGKNDYSYTMVDVNTDFIAGVSRYSRKMRNNLPFLENSLAIALRRDYYKKENELFEAVLASQATASALTSGNEIERLLQNVSVLAASDFVANGIVINPVDYFKIITTEKSTGAGYGLPGVVSIEGGVLRVNGIPVFQASWCPADKYYVGDWSRVTQVVTEGFSFRVSDQDEDNFSTNNITALVEQQTEIVVEQPEALIYGDFTTV